jgi:hypothetical protein
MARLYYLNRRGHTEVSWDVEQAQAGDGEALAAVAEAERLLKEAVGSGYTAFAVRAGAVTRRVHTLGSITLDEDVVLIPPVAGG